MVSNSILQHQILVISNISIINKWNYQIKCLFSHMKCNLRDYFPLLITSQKCDKPQNTFNTAMTHNLCTILSYENHKHNDPQHNKCTYLMKITNMMIINISSVHITYLMKITNIMILINFQCNYFSSAE